MKRVVGRHSARGECKFFFKPFVCDRRRMGIGHFHDGGDPARNRRCRLGDHLPFMSETRFAEVNVAVDHSRQEGFSGGIDFYICGGINGSVDPVDSSVPDEYVARETAAFVYDIGIPNKNGGEIGMLGCWNTERLSFHRADDSRSRRGFTKSLTAKSVFRLERGLITKFARSTKQKGNKKESLPLFHHSSIPFFRLFPMRIEIPPRIMNAE